MFRLFHAPDTCAFACHIALEESGLRYESVRIYTAGGAQRSPEHPAA